MRMAYTSFPCQGCIPTSSKTSISPEDTPAGPSPRETIELGTCFRVPPSGGPWSSSGFTFTGTEAVGGSGVCIARPTLGPPEHSKRAAPTPPAVSAVGLLRAVFVSCFSHPAGVSESRCTVVGVSKHFIPLYGRPLQSPSAFIGQAGQICHQRSRVHSSPANDLIVVKYDFGVGRFLFQQKSEILSEIDAQFQHLWLSEVGKREDTPYPNSLI
ncbi:hypothetical protein TREES_T100015622 [Tupaia chinensis]|uniref:Uncharacterized protein n=1 Tax=Tupaia chinensis TaxID=246437 RepID=L9L7T6_TUPCH|nr:hypothetical protein TREES_T100015622 [Tupaia chinensis]